MQYLESLVNGVKVIKLIGNLDMLNAGLLKENFKEPSSYTDIRIVLEISEVNFIDSSGFGLIMSIRDKLKQNNGELKIANPSKTIRQIFRISKVSSVIPLYETLEDALQSFDQPT